MSTKDECIDIKNAALMHHHQSTEAGHAVSMCLYLWVYPISIHVH